MAKPVVHFEIAGRDGKKSCDFYGKLFDWKINREIGGMDYNLVPAAGDKSIGGGIFTAPTGMAPCVTFYVEVEDLQKYLDKAVSLGGKITQPPTPIPIPGIGSSAMFTDPDGLLIGLFKSNA